MGKKEKEAITNFHHYSYWWNSIFHSFLFQLFTLFGIFVCVNPQMKLSKYKNFVLLYQTLRIISNVNQSDYETLLGNLVRQPRTLKKSERDLATEIFKTINKLNPPFLKKMFKIKVSPRAWQNDVIVKTHNTTTYGDKALAVLGPRIWTSLPENVKSESSYKRFEEYINTRFGTKCYCNNYECSTRKTQQKQPPRSALKKRRSENMQQIYRRTPMPKCYFNKVDLQLYWNRTSA